MSSNTFAIDPIHSSVEFGVTYAMNSIVKGRFHDIGGTIVFDASNPTDSQVTASIGAMTIDTGVDKRDVHLRGDDFLDVERQEQITFNSRSIEVLNVEHWLIHGDLTIAKVTRQVVLDTRYFGTVSDATDTTRAGFVAEVDIGRSDWGLTWNEQQDTGVLVSDRVRVTLYISATQLHTDDPPDTEDGES